MDLIRKRSSCHPAADLRRWERAGLAASPLLLIDRVRRTKEPPTVNAGKTPPTNPLTPGERRAMLIAAVIFVALIAVGVAAWAMTDHSSGYGRSGDSCVNVTIASSMGSAVEHACGAEARDWCRAVAAQHDAHSEAVQAQCRIARILP
jgi:hypothetical protein